MKLFTILHILIAITLLNSCGSDSDGLESGVVGDISELVGYNGPSSVNEQNIANFPFSGQCVGDEQIVLSGSVEAVLNCVDGAWGKTADLSLYPNGVFSITIKTDSGENTFNITKNTLSLDAAASYDFEGVDLGVDSRGAHNAASVSGVVGEEDIEQGKVAKFNGVDSSIVLNGSGFLNDAFTERTVLLRFKSGDLSTNQVLFDEGGSTNAFGIKIESNSLVLATRVGGSSGMESVSIDISGREDQWVSVVASFNAGELKLSTSFGDASTTASYTEIPSHSDTGGLGMKIGSDAFDSTGNVAYSGALDQVMVFSKALKQVERDLFLGKVISPSILNLESLGRVGFLSFANAADLGENDSDSSSSSGVASNVTQGSDAEQGSTAVFAGNSSIQLSDGSYFNTQFATKTYALYFKSTDVFVRQTLIDEGGSTNGISLVLDNGYLVASARSGGESSQVDLIADLSGRSNEWVKVIVSFDQGSFSMQLDSEESLIQRDTAFTTIPDHGDDGGIGRLFGSDAFGSSGSQFFSGEISKFSIYSRALSQEEVSKY